MTRRMFREVVPVDGKSHVFELTHTPTAVEATPDGRGVEFWFENDSNKPCRSRAFMVVGTGHRLPADATLVGTCPRLPSGFVWHLIEVSP